MKASIKIADPEDIEATISLTMSVRQWRDLRTRMEGMPFHGPAQSLREAIWTLSEKVERELAIKPDETEAPAQ